MKNKQLWQQMIKIIPLSMCLVNCSSFGTNGHYCPKLYSVIETMLMKIMADWKNLMNEVRLETVTGKEGWAFLMIYYRN